ncbi:MAG: hypothetical protein ACXACY_13340 [Candidatus Hodarchaeales archaeon]
MKVCKKCNSEFKPSHGNKKFCSEECAKVYYRNYRKDWKGEHGEIEQDYVLNGQRAYNNIRQRCENKTHCQFSNYGGRGIFLSLSRDEFIEIYMSKSNCELCGQELSDRNRNAANGRTLDRIDQARGYEKGNLRLLCRSCNASLSYNRRKNR